MIEILTLNEAYEYMLEDLDEKIEENLKINDELNYKRDNILEKIKK